MKEPEIQSKRFIAGAVCPECNALDRLVVEYTVPSEDQPSLSRRRCVECGFADPFGDEVAVQASGSVPRGKPERLRQRDVAAAKVVILDPGAKPTDG